MIRAALLALIATPALAEDYALPEGCTGLMTVQALDCQVTHYYRCEGDAAGWTRRDDVEETGLVFRTQTDEEARWMESEQIGDDITDTLGPERDPSSLSNLLATGRDDFDFLTYSSDGGMFRYFGYDRLTGNEVTVDGVTLLETAFSMQVEDRLGNWQWSSEGTEYVLPEINSFIGGKRDISTPEDQYSRDSSPKSFARPGEPGFLARRPLYGCGAMLSSLITSPQAG